MPTLHTEHLDREAYSRSTANIDDTKSVGFARQAREWWDRHFSWKAQGCIVLADETDRHLSYIFYKIDRYGDYITVHNLFTPCRYRRSGYARELLRRVFEEASEAHVRRFRMTSVPQSLAFYQSLGMVYWGINGVGDYYCDLPLPEGGLSGVPAMVRKMTVSELVGKSFDTIYTKVGGNEALLSPEQHLAFESDCLKLAEGYMYDALMDLKASRGK